MSNCVTPSSVRVFSQLIRVVQCFKLRHFSEDDGAFCHCCLKSKHSPPCSCWNPPKIDNIRIPSNSHWLPLKFLSLFPAHFAGCKELCVLLKYMWMKWTHLSCFGLAMIVEYINSGLFPMSVLWTVSYSTAHFSSMGKPCLSSFPLCCQSIARVSVWLWPEGNLKWLWWRERWKGPTTELKRLRALNDYFDRYDS